MQLAFFVKLIIGFAAFGENVRQFLFKSVKQDLYTFETAVVNPVIAAKATTNPNMKLFNLISRINL